MRLSATSLVLAGVLIASGGALAMAQTAGPGSTAGTKTASTQATTGTAAPATTEPTSEPSSSTGGDAAETRTPPGWAKRDEKQSEKGGKQGRANGRGPDATGPAAYGLCQAWANQEDPAAKAERVPPFRNLADAAGGVDKVAAYCAALPERPADEDD